MTGATQHQSKIKRVHPRHHIDARPHVALFALGSTLLPKRRDVSSPETTLDCLSVRTAFDLYLRSSDLAPGDEVMMTAITHPDMVRIVRINGLVPVAVDVDPETLAPGREHLAAAFSDRSRLIVHAHLFGARASLDEVVAFARANNLAIVEDCAQALRSPWDKGDERTQISLFSFGFIKTATAFGGAQAHAQDADTITNMRRIQAAYPIQQRREYALKAVKGLVAMALSKPALYGRFVHGRHDPGTFTRSVNSVDDNAFCVWLRRRPCGALIRTLHWRLRNFSHQRLAARTTAGSQMADALPGELRNPSETDRDATHWLFPILSSDPTGVADHLNRAGFDAAPTTSQIRALPGASNAEQMMAQLVFLPAYPEMDRAERERQMRELHFWSKAERS